MEKSKNISKKISWDEGRNLRFRTFFDEKEISQEDFSNKSGMPQSNLSAILNNKRALGEKTIDKYIMPIFPELDKIWLLTGEGSMLKGENEVNLIKAEHKQNTEAQHEVVRIPYYDVDFAGGFNSAELFSNNVMPSFYISSPAFERAEFACNLVGNSISNRVPNGSVIGLREVKDWQVYFPTGEIYGVVLKNDLRTVKIVKRSKDDKNKILLIPDPKNEHNHIGYDVEEVDINFVVKFFQVIAWASFERLAQ